EMLKEVNDLPEDYEYDESFLKNVRKNYLEGNQTDVLYLENEDPVACATLCYISVMPTFSHPTGNRAHLMNVYVKKEFRRHGLARKMLEFLIEEARTRALRKSALMQQRKENPCMNLLVLFTILLQ
ncbi:MAG: GNAT family N-acetyltransferase, partial [Spirochaetales bacterium]|nr:GNAT family N-acetyltransferase [Spirochaetales bacterium]